MNDNAFDRKGHILRRWVSISAYVLVGAIFEAVLVTISSETWFASMLKWLSQFSPTAQRFWIVVMSSVTCSILLRLAPLRISHLKRSSYYPTIWIAGVSSSILGFVALFLVGLAGDKLIAAMPEAFLWLLSGIVLASGVLKLSEWVMAHPKDANHRSDNGDTASKSEIDELVDWLEDESPVTSARQDRFEFQHSATRIARLLLKGRDVNRDLTVGIAGCFGSGKSTLVKLVEEAAQAIRSAELEPELWFASVSCWGFDDAKSALHGILDAAIAEVARHVDTLAVRDLPDDYVEAVSGDVGWLSAIVRRFAPERTPEQRLQRLTPLLSAANTRLVLVVEDLDRVKSPEFAPERILATLHRIKDVSRLSFILSGGANRDGIDFAKLCDHIERAPGVRESVLRKILDRFRTICRTQFPDIDRTSEERRRAVSFPAAEFRHALRLPRYSFVDEAMLELLNTPRTLKHTLRRTWSAWTKLHGEVDFDDLLCVNTLRFAAPEAFEFLLRNIDYYIAHSQPPRDLPRTKENEKEFPLDVVWNDFTKDVEFDVVAAARLVAFLLPLDRESRFFDVAGRETDAPQGIRHTKPVRYFDRILSEDIAAFEVHDQEVLRLIDQATEHGVDVVARCMFESEQFSEQWAHWAQWFPNRLLLPLASELFRLELEHRRSKAALSNEGHMSVWRRAIRQRQDHSNPIDWIKAELCRCLPTSIGFCNDLYYYWAAASPDFCICPIEQGKQLRDEARTLIRTEVRRHFESCDPSLFAASLNGVDGHQYQLYQLVLTPDGSREMDASLYRSPAEWAWLGKTTIAAARFDPTVVIPQIVGLCAKEREDRETHAAILDRLDTEILQGFFGAQAREVVELIAEHASVFENSTRRTPTQVKEIATAWLAANHIV